MTTAAALGSIPFRIRVGVTGHRTVDSRPLLGDVLGEIRRLLPADGATPVRLAVVSALAEGADRLVAEDVFADAAVHGEEARLEAVLPFERRRYSALQEFPPEAEAEFETWLDEAVSVTELAGAWEPATRERAYEAAGRYVVSRCDVLVGVWDGEPSRGRGGTAETLLYAAETGKPSIWLPTDGSLPRLDNLGAGTTAAFQKQVRERALPGAAGPVRETLHREALEQLRTTFRKLDAFNSARLPAEPALRRRVEAELGPVDETSD